MEEWNERQIVAECVWLGSMRMNVSVGRETLFTVIFHGCVRNTSVLTYNVVFSLALRFVGFSGENG